MAQGEGEACHFRFRDPEVTPLASALKTGKDSCILCLAWYGVPTAQVAGIREWLTNQECSGMLIVGLNPPHFYFICPESVEQFLWIKCDGDETNGEGGEL